MNNSRKNPNINVSQAGSGARTSIAGSGARPTSSAYGAGAGARTSVVGSGAGTRTNYSSQNTRGGLSGASTGLGAANNRGTGLGSSSAQMSTQGGSSGGGISAFMKAIIEINKNFPSLNHFFQEFDCYTDRTFEAWELFIIFEGKVSERDIHDLCEKNQTVEALKQNQCKAQYLFDQLKFAPNAPTKFQSGIFEGKPTSLYAQKQPILDQNPQLLQLFQHLLQHVDDLKLGRPEKAFDTLFPKQPNNSAGVRGTTGTSSSKYEEIAVERLRSIAPTYQMTQFSLETFQACVDWICPTQGEYVFTKVNFVAAFRYLIAKYNPTLAQTEKIVIPGINQASIVSTGSSVVPNPAGIQPPMVTNLQSMPTQQPPPPLGGVGFQQQSSANVSQLLQNALQVYFQKQVGTYVQQDCDQMVSAVKQAKQLSLQQRLAPAIVQKLDQLEPCLNQMQLNNPIFQTTTRTLINDVLTESQKAASQQVPPPISPVYSQPVGGVQQPVQQQPLNTMNQMNQPLTQGAVIPNQVQTAQQQELLNRVCEALAMKKKTLPELMMGLQSTPFSGKNTYQQVMFAQKCKEMFSMTDSEAQILGLFFSLQHLGQPTLVDSDAFATKVIQEQNKFTQAVSLYGNLLDRIQDSLRQRHTGVHKWFKSYMQMSIMDQQITKDELQRAIQNLGANVVQSTYELDGLFQGLDFNKSGKIYLSDVESLFKANSRKSMPRINPQEVFVQILRAFNADFEFLKEELGKIQMMNSQILNLEDALNFFKNFNGFQTYYQIDHVHILLDTFVLSGGRVELQDFLYQLNLARQTNNLQPNLQQQGIHRQQSGIGQPQNAGIYQMQQQQPGLNTSMHLQNNTMGGATANNSLYPNNTNATPFNQNQPNGMLSTQEVCETIMKRIDSRNQTIESFLQELTTAQNQNSMHGASMYGQNSQMTMHSQQQMGNQMSQMQFVQTFGAQLNLSPLILREDQLQALFQEISRSNTNQMQQYGSMSQAQSVSHSDISRFFNQKVQIPQLKQKVLQKMQNQPVRRFLEQIPSFNMNQGKVSEPEFKQTLQRSVKIDELDCDFITRFYVQAPAPMHTITSAHQKMVDANQFIRDCQNPSNNMSSNTYMANGGSMGQPTSMDQERQAREALKKISQAIQRDQSATLQRKFNSLQKGRSDPHVELIGFSTILRQINVLTVDEQRHVEMKYANPRSQHLINLAQFMEDLREISRLSSDQSNSQNLSQLPTDLKRDYEQVAQVFKLGDVVSKFVFYLKEKDVTGQGYLNQQMIQSCFDGAYADRKKVQGASLPTNFHGRLPNMFQPVSKNSQGFFSYKEILQLLFGQNEGNRLFAMSKGQLQQLIQAADGDATNVTYSKPMSVVNPANRFMGDIGQKILMSHAENIENQIKVALGPNPKSTKLQANQAEQILSTMQVFLQNEERTALTDWIRQSSDQQGLFDAINWLQALGLPNQTLQVRKERKLPRKILNPQELSECQQLLTMVSRDISQTQGKILQDAINRQSMQGTVKNISPAGFKKFLTQECTRDVNAKLSDNEKLSNLVHYLVLDEPGKVSLIKLLKAFNLGPRDAPLKQDGTQEFTQYSNQIKQQLQRATIKGSAGVPAEVFQLLNFLKVNNLTLQKVFKLKANQIIKSFDIIRVSEFNMHLQEIAFESQNLTALNGHLQTQQDKNKVSLYTLEDFRKKFNKTQTQGRKNQNYGNLSTSTQNKLKNITEWLQFNGHSSQKIHEMLDINKDGVVDRDEFINGFIGAQIRGIKSRGELGQIFDEIDINNDQYLDINEFSIFVKGAQQSREQRINELPKEVQDEIERDLMDLFREFDDDKSGDIDKWEILKIMQGLGVEMNEQKAAEMIASVDTNGNGKIDLEEFKKLMKPKFLEQVLSQEDSLEDFRALFVEADTDSTGFLTADEIYNVLVKQGIVVTFEEMVQLIEQFDVSGDAKLDIDEFIAMMNAGDNLNFSSNSARDTYLKIRKSRRLNVMDFIKAFGNLPQSFVPSIIGKKWNQEKRNLPSSAFSAKIDENTMNWKDMDPVSANELPAEMQQKDNMPALKPVQTSLGAEITLEFAEGIPLPADSTSFDRKTVTKRAIRVCLFDSTTQDFIGNACQIGAKWEQAAEDKWSFNTKATIGDNPIIFRSTSQSGLDPKTISVVFELVLFIKAKQQGKEVSKEVSCGWCMTPLDTLSRDSSKLKLDLQGGTPSAQIIIAENDVNTNRQGIAGLMKAFSSKITSGLCLSVKSFANLEAETKLHMSLLPRACLVPRRLLTFVSGYRNYAAKLLLKQAAFEKTRERPAGNVVISSFNKIMDNPDIQTTLIQVWSEDVLAVMSGAQKKSINFATEKMESVVTRIYPVLHSQEFQLSESNMTQSVSHDPVLQTKRENLLLTALRSGTTKSKSLVNKKPLEEQTSFKPFNVREIEWDSWQGAQKVKSESILNSYQNMGILGGQGGNSYQQSMAPMMQQPFNPNQNIVIPPPAQRQF